MSFSILTYLYLFCIHSSPGANLAMAEIITGLVCVLKSFELAPIANHPPISRVLRFTETFDGEIQLVLKPRPA